MLPCVVLHVRGQGNIAYTLLPAGILYFIIAIVF